MDILSASEARAKLFKLLEQVNKDSQPCIITSRKIEILLATATCEEFPFDLSKVLV